MTKNDITAAGNLIRNSNNITVLTGAGMSTDSGIADFRSPGGVWSKYKTVTIQEFESDTEKRKYYWQYKRATIPEMLKAEPNAAHYALAEMAKKDKLTYILTQNIDGLHEKSGIPKAKIINLHGTNSEAICLSCSRIYKITEVLKRVSDGEDDPLCEHCGGYLKPNTVSFGQNLNPEHLAIAERSSKECDLFMALGSSLLVQPACSYVAVAAHYGKPVIIVNRDATPYDDIAEFKFTDSLAEVLPKLFG